MNLESLLKFCIENEYDLEKWNQRGLEIVEEECEYTSDGFENIIIFKMNDKYYKFSIDADSWEGSYPETAEVCEVTQVEKTIKVWEEV